MDVLKMFDRHMKAEQQDITNPTAFLVGETDRLKDNPVKRGMHDDYYRGYGRRYELEQILTARSSQ